MDESSGPKSTEDEVAERVERLVREAGKAVDWTMNQVQLAGRQVYGAVSKEAKVNAREMARRTSIIMDEAKNELPRLRAELREMEARVRDRIR